MVKHDGGVWKSARQVDDFVDLGVHQPGVEGQAQPRQQRKAGPEVGLHQQPRWRIGAGDLEASRVPGRATTDAAQAPAGGSDVGMQRVFGTRTQTQIDIADDAGANARRTIGAGGAHRGDAVDELCLAQRFQRFRTVRTVHRAALDEHRAQHLVPAADVVQQFRHQVAVAVVVPQMVMRVDDRQIRRQHRFGPQRQPLRIQGDEVVRFAACVGCVHVGRLGWRGRFGAGDGPAD